MTNDSEIWLVGHGRAAAFDDSVTVCCLIWTHFSQHFCKALGVQHRAVGGTFASIIYIYIHMCIYIYIVFTYAHVFVRILHTTMFNNKSIHVPQLDQTCWIIHLKSMLNCWSDVESDTIWRNVHRVQGFLSFFLAPGTVSVCCLSLQDKCMCVSSDWGLLTTPRLLGAGDRNFGRPVSLSVANGNRIAQCPGCIVETFWVGLRTCWAWQPNSLLRLYPQVATAASEGMLLHSSA